MRSIKTFAAGKVITDLTAEECGTPHSNNERIRVETVGRAVKFYVRLMRQC